MNTLTGRVQPVLVQCWAIVYDAGPTLNQHWRYVSRLLTFALNAPTSFYLEICSRRLSNNFCSRWSSSKYFCCTFYLENNWIFHFASRQSGHYHTVQENAYVAVAMFLNDHKIHDCTERLSTHLTHRENRSQHLANMYLTSLVSCQSVSRSGYDWDDTHWHKRARSSKLVKIRCTLLLTLCLLITTIVVFNPFY